DEEKLHLTARVLRAHHLVVELDVVLRERDVVLGLPGNLLGELILGHDRDRDLLDDHTVAGDGEGDVLAADAAALPDRADRLDDRALVHDRSVDDALRRQRLEPKGRELERSLLLPDADHLDRARPDVQPDAIPRHDYIILPLPTATKFSLKSINSVLFDLV